MQRAKCNKCSLINICKENDNMSKMSDKQIDLENAINEAEAYIRMGGFNYSILFDIAEDYNVDIEDICIAIGW